MKKSLLLMSLAGALILASCSEEKKDEKSTEKKEDKKVTGYYLIDNGSSTIGWKGENRDKADHAHYGTLPLSGDITVEDGVVKNAMVNVDLQGLITTDLKDNEEKAGYLKGHLLNGDFFAIDSVTPAVNPTFEVTSVADGKVSGKLTVRGVTVNVEIPANVEITETEVKVTADKFTVDFLPFSMPFFAQEKEKKSEDDHITILKGEVELGPISLVAKKQ